MGGADAAARRWALLIGIDCYKTRPLKGAVRDVEGFRKYLRDHYEAVDIQTLTASSSTDANSARPIEAPGSWPTFANVTSGLDRITHKARCGDFVHIHFSGHGTQIKDGPNASNKDTGDLALVLYDADNAQGMCFLYGWRLANEMKKMVDKGFLVTLVLDCCFSGSVLRDDHGNDTRIRTVPYYPAIDIEHPLKLPGNSTSHDTLRDARLRTEWLVNPDGYTILTACNPYEYAGEFRYNGDMHGALSLLLSLALEHYGQIVAFKSLYEYLCSLFSELYPRQTPMLFGNPDHSFFEKLTTELDIASVGVFRRKGRLCLEAGAAHGVYCGDEYTVYPANLPDVSKNLNPILRRAKVDTVRGLTSDLILTDSESDEHIKTGWRARPLTSSTPHKITVSLRNNVDVATVEQRTAPKHEKRFLRTITEDEHCQPCHFSIGQNQCGDYEIFDQSDKRISGLPSVSYKESGALDRVLSILGHLATFKFFEQINNQESKLSFSARLSNTAEVCFGSEGFTDHNEDKELSLTIRNLGREDLYVAIFNLGPLYQIENLLHKEQFRPVPGKKSVNQSKIRKWPGETVIRLRTFVPDYFKMKGMYYCNDIFKVFITSRPSLFTQFLLPELTESIQGPAAQPTRSAANGLKLLVKRTMLDQEYDPFEGDWVTRNFCVHTVADKGKDIDEVGAN